MTRTPPWSWRQQPGPQRSPERSPAPAEWSAWWSRVAAPSLLGAGRTPAPGPEGTWASAHTWSAPAWWRALQSARRWWRRPCQCRRGEWCGHNLEGDKESKVRVEKNQDYQENVDFKNDNLWFIVATVNWTGNMVEYWVIPNGFLANIYFVDFPLMVFQSSMML